FLGFDVPGYLRSLEAYNGNPRDDGTAYDYSMAAPQWNPLESYRVEEKTNAFYVQADLSGDRWNADVGVRVVSTRTRAEAWDAKITDITELGAINYTATYGDPTPIVQAGSYTYVLPSGTVTSRFTDDPMLP